MIHQSPQPPDRIDNLKTYEFKLSEIMLFRSDPKNMKLAQGLSTRIAAHCNCSASNVTLVVKGRHHNPTIVDLYYLEVLALKAADESHAAYKKEHEGELHIATVANYLIAAQKAEQSITEILAQIEYLQQRAESANRNYSHAVGDLDKYIIKYRTYIENTPEFDQWLQWLKTRHNGSVYTHYLPEDLKPQR